MMYKNLTTDLRNKYSPHYNLYQVIFFLTNRNKLWMKKSIVSNKIHNNLNCITNVSAQLMKECNQTQFNCNNHSIRLKLKIKDANKNAKSPINKIILNKICV